ncbi:MAG: flagellar hook protein FlgE [Bryobacteraceae bacterium]
MFTSFSSALSALNAHATAVDVVGNNLANANTPGYKASTYYFRDLVSQSMRIGGGETQVGMGTGQPITIRQFSQGAIQSSGGPLDAAIQGDGFFIVRNIQGNTLYTRAGSFKLDSAGNLITATGERVQGWTSTDPITGVVNTSGPIGDVVLPKGSLQAPKPTTSFNLNLNLDARVEAGAASAFSTPVEVFDSLGGAHVLTVTFEKTGPNVWQYTVSIPGSEVSGGTAGSPYPLPGASGTLTFGSDGRLADPAAGAPVAIDITGLSSGASDMHLTWDLYTAANAGRLTQFGQPSAVSSNQQNGSPAAQLVRVELGDGGRILAQYSNGAQVMVGQLALASVVNPEALLSVGNNAFQLSARTATPVVGTPGTGGRGEIVGAAIEYSTVDIAREFTNLIMLQRGYQANSRVITTVDQLSEETINLKR